jgi:hypothetical protein
VRVSKAAQAGKQAKKSEGANGKGRNVVGGRSGSTRSGVKYLL